MSLLLQSGHWAAGKSKRLIEAHTNPGLEIVLVANGAVSWDYDGTEVHVPAGHISYSWPWQVHGAQDVKLPAVDLYWILIPLNSESISEMGNLNFASNYGLKSSEIDLLIKGLQAYGSSVLRINRDFRRYFIRLVKRLLRNQCEFDWEARGLFLLSMYHLRASLEGANRMDEVPGKLEQVRCFWEDVLPSKLDHHWTLDEMAQCTGMGRSSFAGLTKKLYGDTPIPTLTRHRLDLAKKLLLNSDQTITEIAFRCGFNSSQSFATVFKAYIEQSPSDFRRSGFS